VSHLLVRLELDPTAGSGRRWSNRPGVAAWPSWRPRWRGGVARALASPGRRREGSER